MSEFIHHLVDLVLHIDRHLQEVIGHYGTWTYALLFLIIFAETGLVVTPFLPGDSLLFAAGALCAGSVLNVHLLVALLAIAAVAGNLVNYGVGAFLGPKVFSREDSWLLRKKHLERAHAFFERYGGRSIVLSRFMPIIRTFVPFVAGVGRMPYPRFFLFNLVGGVAWICLLTYLGYFFGGTELVRKNFSLVIVGIIGVSLLPIVIEAARAWMDSRRRTGAK
ncbi:MAG TPA: DedA family protein [Opitutaceae bacterium]|nr:DedA family protein [Opitutaceae bacterium]